MNVCAYLIADGDIEEARRHVGRDVLVALLETVVLLDVVEVVTADDSGALQ